MRRAVSAIIRAEDTGRVIFVRRKNPPRQGQWSLPGGSIELDETDEAAIRREIDEELAITLAIEVRHKLTSVRVTAAPDDYLIEVFFFAIPSEITLTPRSDATFAAWLDPFDARAHGVSEDTAALVRDACEEAARTRPSPA